MIDMVAPIIFAWLYDFSQLNLVFLYGKHAHSSVAKKSFKYIKPRHFAIHKKKHRCLLALKYLRSKERIKENDGSKQPIAQTKIGEV